MDRITKGYMNNFAASQELTGKTNQNYLNRLHVTASFQKNTQSILIYRILLQVVEVMRELMELQLLPIMS